MTVTLRGNIANARAELAIEKLQLADRQLRDSAIRTGRACSLVLDLSRRTLVRSEQGRPDVLIAEDIPIVRFWSDEDGPLDDGRAKIRFRPDGTSPSYAACLTQNRRTNAWIIFAGFTGKTLLTSDVGEVEQLLRR